MAQLAYRLTSLSFVYLPRLEIWLLGKDQPPLCQWRLCSFVILSDLPFFKDQEVATPKKMTPKPEYGTTPNVGAWRNRHWRLGAGIGQQGQPEIEIKSSNPGHFEYKIIAGRLYLLMFGQFWEPDYASQHRVGLELYRASQHR